MIRKLKTQKGMTVRQRGWGLTETLLALGAISVMSLAVYAVFKPTSVSAQVHVEQDNLRELSRNIDRSFGMLGSFEDLDVSLVERDALAPARMSAAGEGLRTDWGTPVSIGPYEDTSSGVGPNTAFSVTYPGTPAAVCSGLASAVAGDAFDIKVGGQSVFDSYGLNPTLSSERCSAGNVTMEFVFHSGLVAGQAVAAPPLVLPPAPPGVAPPPSSPPPTLVIPENPDVDDATPGVLPDPPPSAPPPVLPPPLVPPGPVAPVDPIDTTPPPIPGITNPGVICTPPATWTEGDERFRQCGAGYYGMNQQVRERQVSYSCPEAWDVPVRHDGPWQAWVDVTTCDTCPTLTPQVEVDWESRSVECPIEGQAGTVTQEHEIQRSRSRAHVCEAGTTSLPPITYGDWTNWSDTGNTRNRVSNCECPSGEEVQDGECVPARIDCPAPEEEKRQRHNVNMCAGQIPPLDNPAAYWGGNVTMTEVWRREAIECTTAGIVWGDWVYSSGSHSLQGGCWCERIPYYGDPLRQAVGVPGGWAIHYAGGTEYIECR